MQNLNRLPAFPHRDEAETRMTYATVAGRVGAWFFLDGVGDPALERAQRATSCLIEPERGDTVLAIHDGTAAGSYILAVLARAEPGKAELLLPGGVAMQADAGALTVRARQVNLEASESAAMQAPSVVLSGISGTLRFQRLEAAAQKMRAHFGAVQGMAQSMTATVGRLVQRVGNSLRWIDGLDETRAGRVRMQVEDRFDLESRHVSMRAVGQVKIDGEKIDLG
ncbi:MAG: DUF3540 domain-containing protein [Bordetella sp.]|uniref:DUF3540 domain-containing protein n=1 Tax=Bordetella sp. TaxID=28081 RepID=UPI003F7B918E